MLRSPLMELTGNSPQTTLLDIYRSALNRTPSAGPLIAHPLPLPGPQPSQPPLSVPPYQPSPGASSSSHHPQETPTQYQPSPGASSSSNNLATATIEAINHNPPPVTSPTQSSETRKRPMKPETSPQPPPANRHPGWNIWTANTQASLAPSPPPRGIVAAPPPSIHQLPLAAPQPRYPNPIVAVPPPSTHQLPIAASHPQSPPQLPQHNAPHRPPPPPPQTHLQELPFGDTPYHYAPPAIAQQAAPTIDPLSTVLFLPRAPPPPGDPDHRVWRPGTNLNARRNKSQAFAFIANPRLYGSSDGSMANTPYIYTNSSLTQQFTNGVSISGLTVGLTSYGQALATALNYYNHQTHLPDTFCLNCFTHHLPSPCPYPHNDFTTLLKGIPAKSSTLPALGPCPRCKQIHAPTNDATTPFGTTWAPPRRSSS